MNKDIAYGAVKITKGKYKGCIGYYDDDDYDNGKKKAIIYLGNPRLSTGYIMIPIRDIDNIITTEDMFRRQEIILQKFAEAEFEDNIEEQAILLAEFLLIETLFSERYIHARFRQSSEGKRVFISHSSEDKTFAKLLATDIAEAGHKPWLDEWEIRAGDSIPREITKGLDQCDYLIIVLTENSTNSNWVENEWQSKYWDEVSTGEIKIIPLLLQKCKIPRLLIHKKYANFSVSYESGLEEVLAAIL